MLNDIQDKVHSRVQRQLPRTPRLATLHAAAFTLFAAFFAFMLILVGADRVAGLAYWMLLLWAFPLAIHAVYTFWRSGAWRGRRSRVLHDEVLDAGETYGLTTDEMIELHLRLDNAVRAQSQPFNRVLFNGLGNLLLWPGSVAAILFAQWLGTGYWFSSFISFPFVLVVMLMGTLGLGLLLPLRDLLPFTDPLRHYHTREDTLRAMYAEKRKRHFGESSQRLSDLMDDEPVDMDEIVEIKRKTL